MKINRLTIVQDYRKTPKNLNTRKNCCNCPKIETMSFYYRVIGPEDEDGMANTVDPDQTAPLGATDLVYTVCQPRHICPKT